MSDIVKETINYFQPPSNYFWRWAENGDVIEWVNGSTICYREELMFILKGMETDDLPPLGSLLLTLSACQDNWKKSNDYFGVLRGLLKVMKAESMDPKDESIEFHIHQALKFLDTLNELPEDFRKGAFKKHLFYEIFIEEVETENKTSEIISEFASGRLDQQISRFGPEITRKPFFYEIQLLSRCLKRFPNKETLELKIRTGLENLPDAFEFEEPEIEQLDLLGQLQADPKTEGVARLTKALVAALNIPMHAEKSSDLSFGGYSDITNRGNFDRLLLTELAQEDALLTARLVNNEALFLRREEPPDQQKRERVILVDSSIKLWGLPRVFAISAALGCFLNNKNNSSSKAYSLGNTDYKEIDLTTKRGLIDALDNLDIGLNCYEALANVNKAKQAISDSESVLITEQETVKDFNFSLLLSELPHPLNYIITVSREGDFKLFEVIKGRYKQLSTAKFDLEKILFKSYEAPKKREVQGAIPAYLNKTVSPLLFPTTGASGTGNNCFYEDDLGAVLVSEQQRVLYWSKKECGARELLNYIEKGEYRFGFDGLSTIYILVFLKNTTLLKMYKFFINQDESKCIILSERISKPVEAVFHNNSYYIETGTELIIYDCIKDKLAQRKGDVIDPDIFNEYFANLPSNKSSILKGFVYNGYSVLQNVKKIHVNQYGVLCVDDHEIMNLGNVIKLSKEKVNKGVLNGKLENPTVEYLLENPFIKFRRFIWKDGSEAVVDSRGLLHLKSSDTSLPEITIILSIGKSTACWASDGAITGSYYFTSLPPSSLIPSDNFYRNYIKPFTEVISGKLEDGGGKLALLRSSDF